MRTNGWTFCPVDIMDEDGDISLPIPGGKWLKEAAVGEHILKYDSMLALTHFKGHIVGGFGRPLKNISIGCTFGKVGKQQIQQRPEDGSWPGGSLFMERMVEGGKAITMLFGKHIASIKCCPICPWIVIASGGAARLTAPDRGILALTGLLAVDKASMDMVYALPEV